MGADHTVETLAAWKLPTGRQMTPGQVIRERTATTGAYDQPGDWARALNTLYELARPPVVRDAYYTPLTSSGADTYQTLARYRVPIEHALTGLSGSDRERLQLRARVRVQGGDTGRLRLDGSQQTATFTSATYTWVDLPTTLSFETEPGQAPEILIEGKATTDGTNLEVAAVEVSWDDQRTTLPNGEGRAYFSGYAPLSADWYGTLHHGLGVEQMRRLMRNARAIHQHRTPGLICSNWLPASTSKKGLLWRARAWQRAHVRQAEVWVYLVAAASGPGDGLTFTLGGQSLTIPNLTTGWTSVVLTLEPHRDRRPRAHDLTLEADVGTGNSIQGVCAWWRPFGSLSR